MSEANKQLVRRWYEEVWNQQSEAAIDAMFHRDGISYGFPSPESALKGPEDFKIIHSNFCGAFPDLHVTVEDLIAEGDKVAARWTVTMTHLGDHLGIRPSGVKASLTGTSIVVIKDGMIREGWNHMDLGHLFKTLEAVAE
jgi:predicted ester cyclase